SNFPLSKRRLGNVRFFAPLVGGLSGRRSASSIVRRSTNVHCEQLFAPPAAFDFVARLRWRLYAAVVRPPSTPRHPARSATIPPSLPLTRRRLHRSCELREFQHNVAPTCQGLPSKSTRVARPRLSLDRLAGVASAHSRLGHSLL